MAARSVDLGTIRFANDAPFVLIGGINVLESKDFALEVAGHYKAVCTKLGIPLVHQGAGLQPRAWLVGPYSDATEAS